tara:strand:- start:613 stop:783 length:171 start_codon:yes stop_codon:yes gene_type:complete
MPEKQVEVEISLEDVLSHLSPRGQAEWDLAMKRAEIDFIQKRLESGKTESEVGQKA